MIGKLKGVIDSFGEDFVILDVNGVGYVVTCSSRTLAHLPRPGEPATLAIETQVREDSIRLFGFLQEAERDWFRLLQSVQGVGSKVALALLSTLSADALAAAVAGQDKAMVARAPGVGPKLAARIVAELKDKAPAGAVAAFAAEPAEETSVASAARDAISALCNLGYGRPQAQAAISASLAALGPEAEASALIRRGLKELAQ
ncbi:Holliday junction branch migration protein RuvA [Methylocystis bryophila]|uniref:Holliday junction branch migration complex subunit RuvA n=1 Tax=Methylocystis bryophila TaxID=655015 RepID=A0A1W6MYQ2_9HYPH|nr:Holliday junction branch migration protein RuvA [Methylocystis bryophila]ARN82669.1 Holliday junction branch migration protein RuvA [Methylocystis bryophila]BDV38887.1 Holliday junction ATP-dependent DNA helicase RuvA [Methylocystis bryophila]